MIPVAFASLAAGAVVVIAGITGSSIQSVARGKPDKANANPKLDTASSATGGTPAPASNGLPKAAHAQLVAIAKRKGWSVNDWLAVIGLESGGNPASVNSETGAYGIGQLNPENASNPRSPRPGSTASKYPGYDGSASEQINAMASYIENTYGTPTAALAAEHTKGWY